MATQKHIETQRANYWGLGWVAFPISVSWNVDRNKKDLCPPPNWQNLTLESAKQLPLRSSLGQGLAIQTGQLSGIIVLDIDDVGKWNEFLVGKGQETPGPDTVTARSQRGGLHLYFRWIDALSDIKSTSALLGGCADVRSTGGMIIAPPTSFLVPGETERRRYSWLEGKSPWECELGDMPVWLAEALRSSGGCSHKKSTGTKVALDGPDTMATPDVIKEFIAEHFLVGPTLIGNTKWLHDGYVIATGELYCPFKRESHKSNKQYLYVSAEGVMSRRCHDGGVACKDQKWGVQKLRLDLVKILEEMFPKEIVPQQVIDEARQEALTLVNDVHPGNDSMIMVHKPDGHTFEGALDSYYGKASCFICGKGRLVAITNKDGLAIHCDHTSCTYRSPAMGAMPVSLEKYKQLGNFFMIVNLHVTNSSTTINNYGSEAMELPSVFLGDDVTVRPDPDLNALILDALDGSDSTLATLFSHFYRDSVVYASDEHWYIFRNHRWLPKKVSTLTRMIDHPTRSELLRALTDALSAYKQSSVPDKEAKIKRILLTIQSLKSDKKQTTIFSKCRNEGLLGEEDDTFLRKLDSNQNLLGFNNGVYDLKTHTFRSGVPEDYITMSVGYDYNHALMTNAGIRQEIQQFFRQVFPDEEVRQYVMVYLASTLEGYNREHKFHFAHGSSGRNGKGILMKIMEHTLGEYAVSVNSALICGKSADANSATPQLTLMVKKRFAYMSEVQEGARLNEELFKRLSGGDRLQMRKLFEEMREIDNTAKILMCCNDMPKIDGSKQANAPRIVIIPFISRFKEGECDHKRHEYPVDRTLETRVGDWKYAMMGILLEFHGNYLREGLKPLPETMKRIKMEYLGANNPESLLEQYIRERLTEGGDGVTTDEILSDYRRWEADVGVNHPDSNKKLKMIQHFDKLLLPREKMENIIGGDKASNVRRFGPASNRKQGYAGWRILAFEA